MTAPYRCEKCDLVWRKTEQTKGEDTTLAAQRIAIADDHDCTRFIGRRRVFRRERNGHAS